MGVRLTTFNLKKMHEAHCVVANVRDCVGAKRCEPAAARSARTHDPCRLSLHRRRIVLPWHEPSPDSAAGTVRIMQGHPLSASSSAGSDAALIAARCRS